MNDEGGDRWHLGHRPALDGLRGIAIILVLIAHGLIPGHRESASIGVGLFFTLSGFLITGLLLEERAATGRISFRGFYLRRARRLFPALFAMVAACAAARVALGPWFLDWAHIPAVLLYVGNWLPANGINPLALGHTWTLSVEEQFYLLWPLVVAAVATRARVVMVATTLAAASLLARVVLLVDYEDANRIILGSDTVAVALLAGAVTVGLRLAGGPGRTRPWLLAVGLAGLAGCLLLSQMAVLLFGLPLIALATCVVLWGATGRGGVPWLEGRVLRWFGSRSYGIYVWHAPLLWAMAYHYEQPWWIVSGVGIPVSLLMAEASYRWIEAPFRARRSAPDPTHDGTETGASVEGAGVSRA